MQNNYFKNCSSHPFKYSINIKFVKTLAVATIRNVATLRTPEPELKKIILNEYLNTKHLNTFILYFLVFRIFQAKKFCIQLCDNFVDYMSLQWLLWFFIYHHISGKSSSIQSVQIVTKYWSVCLNIFFFQYIMEKHDTFLYASGMFQKYKCGFQSNCVEIKIFKKKLNCT